MIVNLAGVIGAGKSSATTILSEHFGSEAFYEPVTQEDNPILEKFYEDKSRYSFELQINFLCKRFAMIKRALQTKNAILDRSIYEDQLFAKINYLNGDMEEYQYKMYCELVDEMMEEIKGMPKKAPDLLVYLKIPFEVELERIAKRGRECEGLTEDDIAYYRSLYDAYDEWFDNFDKCKKIKIENWAEHDLALPEGQEYLINEVEKALKKVK